MTRRFEPDRIIQRNGWRFGSCLDGACHRLPLQEVSEDERLNGGEVRATGGVEPAVEVGRREACSGNSLPAEAAAISLRNFAAVIDKNDHGGSLLSRVVQRAVLTRWRCRSSFENRALINS